MKIILTDIDKNKKKYNIEKIYTKDDIKEVETIPSEDEPYKYLYKIKLSSGRILNNLYFKSKYLFFPIDTGFSVEEFYIEN